MDTTTLYLVAGGLAGLAIVFFVARLMEPAYRCRMLRRFLKKPYFVLKLIHTDANLITTYVVNGEKDTLIVDSNMWAITEGRVYKECQGKKGKRKLDKKSGFSIKAEIIKSDEGAPTVHVNKETMTIIGFEKTEKSAVKPEEIGSTLLAWNFNQLQKALAGVNKQKTILMIIVAVAAIAAFMGWQADGKANQCNVKLDSINAKLDKLVPSSAAMVPAGGTIEGDKIKITQPGAGT